MSDIEYSFIMSDVSFDYKCFVIAFSVYVGFLRSVCRVCAVRSFLNVKLFQDA